MGSSISRNWCEFAAPDKSQRISDIQAGNAKLFHSSGTRKSHMVDEVDEVSNEVIMVQGAALWGFHYSLTRNIVGLPPDIYLRDRLL